MLKANTSPLNHGALREAYLLRSFSFDSTKHHCLKVSDLSQSPIKLVLLQPLQTTRNTISQVQVNPRVT